MVGYKIAKPSEYLIITGAGITDIKITKKAFIAPFQTCTIIDVSPLNYTLSLQAMSVEKLEFTLPAVFTIGPKDGDMEALGKYARLLSGKEQGGQHVQDIVRGVIEGETRVIAAGMTMEEIFKERKYFKETVIKMVQAELDQFGLFIYNANVKQLEDSQGSEYFVYLRMKSHEGAVNQAKVDVAEARFKGDVGEKQRQGQTRQETARIEAEATIVENQRQNEIAKAQSVLQTSKTEYERNVKIARIEADKAAAVRDAELQKDVEMKRALVEQEKLRADTFAKAKIGAESTVTEADAALYKAQKEADAKLYQQEKSAQGIRAVYEAQASGIASLTSAFGGSSQVALQYLMLEKGLYQELAASNAEAIRGLNPKITVWNTGSGDHGGSDSFKAVRDVFQALPPLLTTINDQTGVAPPAWLAQLPPTSTTSNAPVSSLTSEK